jgi:hypothetical protein
MVEIANTPIKICSRASLLIGGNPISSFTDGSSEATVAGAMYEDIARAALTNCRWRFSTSQAQLSRLTEAPTGRFDAAYQLPSDLMLLNAVTVNDFNIEYDTYGTKIYCDTSVNDVLVADYVFRADENVWPPYFTVAVEYTMAAVLAISVARDASLAKMMEEKASIQMMQARRLHSQSQTTKKLNTSRFKTRRLS